MLWIVTLLPLQLLLLVKVMVDVEFTPDGLPVHFRAPYAHISTDIYIIVNSPYCVLLGGGRKPENLKDTQTSTGNT